MGLGIAIPRRYTMWLRRARSDTVKAQLVLQSDLHVASSRSKTIQWMPEVNTQQLVASRLT